MLLISCSQSAVRHDGWCPSRASKRTTLVLLLSVVSCLSIYFREFPRATVVRISIVFIVWAFQRFYSIFGDDTFITIVHEHSCFVFINERANILLHVSHRASHYATNNIVFVRHIFFQLTKIPCLLLFCVCGNIAANKTFKAGLCHQWRASALLATLVTAYSVCSLTRPLLRCSLHQLNSYNVR